MNYLIKILRTIKRFYRISKSFLFSIIVRFPANKLKLIGVTGTSGKSTTVTLIYHILKKNNFRVGLISTITAIAGETKIDTGLHVTTPDPIQLQQILKKMLSANIEYVVLEASSHSLEQGRLGFMKFIYAVFTNIKKDHLDYHIDWENYANDKARLIKRLKLNGKVVINKDDMKSYNYLNKKIKNQKVIEYSVQEEVEGLKQNIDGLTFSIKNQIFNIPIIGEYNLSNILAAIKVCQDLGVSIEDIAESLIDFPTLEGRMQIIQKKPFIILINFAHNTDSLERSLKSLRAIVKKENKIILVFGSAGLRDKEKRSSMGEVAAKLADIIIITAEDPRSESLYEINSRIIKGAEQSEGKLIRRFKNHREYLEYITQNNYVKDTALEKKIVYVFDEENVNSRLDAINFALRIAKDNDLVVTEGKGHEQSLCFGEIEYPYTDKEAIETGLKNLLS